MPNLQFDENEVMSIIRQCYGTKPRGTKVTPERAFKRIKTMRLKSINKDEVIIEIDDDAD